MLEVSNEAMSFLKNVLETEPQGPNLFRLVLKGDSIGLSVAAAEDGDVVYEQGGVAILAAPADLAEQLDSKVLDVEETANGPRLVMST